MCDGSGWLDGSAMPLCRPNVVEPGWRVLEVSEPPLAMPVPAVPSFGGAASSDAGGAAGLKAGAGAGAPVSQPGRRTVAVQSLFQDCRSPSEFYAKLSQASANRASPTSGQAILPPLVAPRQPLFGVTSVCDEEYPKVLKCSGKRGGFAPAVTVPDGRLVQSAGDSPILPDQTLMPLSSPSCLPSFLDQRGQSNEVVCGRGATVTNTTDASVRPAAGQQDVEAKKQKLAKQVADGEMYLTDSNFSGGRMPDDFHALVAAAVAARVNATAVTVPDGRLVQSAGDSPILPDQTLMPLSSPSCLPSFLQQTIASKRNGQQLPASTTPVTERWAKPQEKRKSSSGTEAEVQEAVQEEVQEEAVVGDCGSCRYCRDKQKFGGQHRLRQKCELKTFVQRQTKARSQAAKSGLAREQHELTWQPTNAMQVDLVQRDAAKRSANKKAPAPASPCMAMVLPATPSQSPFRSGLSLAASNPQERLRSLMKEQRDLNTGLWKTSFAFPGQNDSSGTKDPMQHAAMEAARHFVCLGPGCQNGQCGLQLGALDVNRLRETLAPKTKCGGSDTDILRNIIAQHRDVLAPGAHRRVLVPVGGSGSECKVDVCMPAFAVLGGYTGGTYKKIRQQAADRAVPGRELVPAGSGALASKRERETEVISMTRAYIDGVLASQHEMQPVASLGSTTGQQTAINKQSWPKRYEDMDRYFVSCGTPPERIPHPDMRDFKRLWRESKRIKDKQMSTHSKCTVCSNICSRKLRLAHLNWNSERAKAERKATEVLRARHADFHLGERTEMDMACLRSIVGPESIWVIMVDSATERNFQLPRIKGRSGSKELSMRPFWGFKLIASYAPNYGFCPFIVHNSSSAGANLMLTVTWVTLCRMRSHFGYLPSELHLQLDNTSAENKNSTVVAFAAWLVARGYVKRVRLFYLPVGHTHIIIDQVFIGTRNTSMNYPTPPLPHPSSPPILPTCPPPT